MRILVILLCLGTPTAAAAQVNLAELSAVEIAERYLSTAASMMFSPCPAVSARNDSMLIAVINTVQNDEQRRRVSVAHPSNRGLCNDERMNQWMRDQLMAMHPGAAHWILSTMMMAGIDDADIAAIRGWLFSGVLSEGQLERALLTFTQPHPEHPVPLSPRHRVELLLEGYGRVELPSAYVLNEVGALLRHDGTEQMRNALLEALMRNPRAPSAASFARALGAVTNNPRHEHSPAWRARLRAAMQQLSAAPPGTVPEAVRGWAMRFQ
jgi:hypothetical protein